MSIKWFILNYKCNIRKMRMISMQSQLIQQWLLTSINRSRQKRRWIYINNIILTEIQLPIRASNNIQSMSTSSHRMSSSRFQSMLVLNRTFIPSMTSHLIHHKVIITLSCHPWPSKQIQVIINSSQWHSCSRLRVSWWR